MPLLSSKYAFYVSSIAGILVQRPGAPAGSWIGASVVNGVTTWDTSVIVPISKIEFATNKAQWNSLKASLTQRTEQEYADWLAGQDATVDMDALLSSSFSDLAGLPNQVLRQLLISFLQTVMDRDLVAKSDMRSGIVAVIASNPPHPFSGTIIATLVWQEYADGCTGAPVCTIVLLQDPTVDETTSSAVMTKKLAQRLVAQRIANGG